MLKGYIYKITPKNPNLQIFKYFYSEIYDCAVDAVDARRKVSFVFVSGLASQQVYLITYFMTDVFMPCVGLTADRRRISIGYLSSAAHEEKSRV